jgi:hypothetical protein
MSKSNHNGSAKPSREELEKFILEILPKPRFDFRFENHDSICFLRPLNDAAEAWVNEHVSKSGYQPSWPDVLIERRYAETILRGIIANGFSIDGAA